MHEVGDLVEVRLHESARCESRAAHSQSTGDLWVHTPIPFPMIDAVPSTDSHIHTQPSVLSQKLRLSDNGKGPQDLCPTPIPVRMIDAVPS